MRKKNTISCVKKRSQPKEPRGRRDRTNTEQIPKRSISRGEIITNSLQQRETKINTERNKRTRKREIFPKCREREPEKKIERGTREQAKYREISEVQRKSRKGK